MDEQVIIKEQTTEPSVKTKKTGSKKRLSVNDLRCEVLLLEKLVMNSFLDMQKLKDYIDSKLPLA